MLSWLCLAAAPGIAFSQQANTARVEAIRFWSFGDVTRVAIQTQGGYHLTRDQLENPARAFFDFSGLRPPASAHRGYETLEVNDHRVKQIRIAPLNGATTRVVFDLEAPAEIIYSQLVNPDRLMIEIRPKTPLPPGVLVTRTIMGAHTLEQLAVAETTPTAKNGAVPPPQQQPETTQRVVSPRTVNQGVVPDASKSGVGSDSPRQSSAETTSPRKESETATRASTQLPTGGGAKAPVRQTPVPLTPATLPDLAMNVPVPAPGDKGLEKTLPEKKTPEKKMGGDTAVAADKNGGSAGSEKDKFSGMIVPPVKGNSSDRSLVRVLGLKMARVVIDPGHGGHDTGTIGPGGLLEKDLVLDVALRLGELITHQLGAEVVYTRSTDEFIPLEQRTKIANDQKADLFISIHANSSADRTATGVETYYFNYSSDRAGLDLATRENAMASSSISDLNDLLHKVVLQTKLEESREFAQEVQTSLWGTSLKINTRSRNRGVRKAPFVVLIGATMPSILAEVGFVSNPHDEKFMRRSDQRQKIAEGLFKGVSTYAGSLGHLQLAAAGSSSSR